MSTPEKPALGRPREIESPHSAGFTLAKKHVEFLDRWQRLSGAKTRSAALREALDVLLSIGVRRLFQEGGKGE